MFKFENLIHVWKFHVQSFGEGSSKISYLNYGNTCLSPDEKARAKKMISDKSRIEFVESRMALRNILAEYVQINPAKIEFTYNTYGKPLLKNNKFDIQFNLSHSGGYGLLAICQGKKIGVDIEQEQDNIDYNEIRLSHFSDLENQYFQTLNIEEQKKAFYQIWARKEALAKALGTGFSMPLQCFEVPTKLSEQTNVSKTCMLRNWKFQSSSYWCFYDILTNYEKSHAALVVEDTDIQTDIKVEEYHDYCGIKI